MSTPYDVIIIGSGPAGFTAALYNSRAFLKTLILEGVQPGGQLTITTEVENYPGFPNGIQGPKLMSDMRVQVERFGTEIRQELVRAIARNGPVSKPVFEIKTDSSTYIGKSVIISSGASAQYLGIPAETTYAGKGVSACATCDGFFYRGKEVVVVGGGDTAMEEATFLTRFASKVTIVHRRDQFRASAIMLEKARKEPKIAFLTNKIVTDLTGEPTVAGVVLQDVVTGKSTNYPAQGFFLAIGHKPNTDFLKGFVELDEKGYVKITNYKLQINNDKAGEAKSSYIQSMMTPQTMTSVEGVFAAGDCTDPRYRQAIVAAGMGCMAAIDAQKWLEDQG
jgi:thioredoxin reductase (NADPH)